MGIFRTKKVDKYSIEDIESHINTSRELVIAMCRSVDLKRDSEFLSKKLDEALHEWAEWREALARKHNENKSPLDV